MRELGEECNSYHPLWASPKDLELATGRSARRRSGVGWAPRCCSTRRRKRVRCPTSQTSQETAGSPGRSRPETDGRDEVDADRPLRDQDLPRSRRGGRPLDGLEGLRAAVGRDLDREQRAQCYPGRSRRHAPRTICPAHVPANREAGRWQSTPTSSRGSTSRARWSTGRSTASTRRRCARSGASSELDFARDAADWQRIDAEQQRGLLGVTVRFLAGEQAVTNELVPMLAAAHALRRFDWTIFLSTFLLEEARHAEFFMRWHEPVVGILEPHEVAAHFLVRGKTIDPTGRFEVKDLLHEGLPALRRRADGGRRSAAARPTSSAPSCASRPPTTPSPRASSRCRPTRS